MINTLADIIALRSIIPRGECPDEPSLELFASILSGPWRDPNATAYASTAMEAVLVREMSLGNQDTDEFREALATYFDYIWSDVGSAMTEELLLEARNASAN